MGNPYEESISLSKFREAMDYTNVAEYYYLWNPVLDDNNGAYQVYQKNGFMLPEMSFNGVVPAHSAFWIQTTGENPTFRFSRTQFDDGLGEKNTDSSESGIILSIRKGHLTGRTAIAFSDSKNDLQIDVPYLFPLRADFLELFSMNSELPILIQYVQTELNNLVEIPIHVSSSTSGAAVLSRVISNFIPENLHVFLRDNVTGILYNLREPLHLPFELTKNESQENASLKNRVSPIRKGATMRSGESRFHLVINNMTTDTARELYKPGDLKLSQNYPNPFNPTTNITFGLPESGQVNLDVYNVMGQRVATLVNDKKPAGYHTVSFDASRLASGTYIYQLHIISPDGSGAINTIITKKLLLIK